MSKDLSEYGFSKPTRASAETNLMQSMEKRAEAEVQAAYIIAKKYPRNLDESDKRIQAACGRKMLAEQAMYEYPRGNTRVRGPSIRLAEVLAQAWGNIDCGVREISQNKGVSVAEAYAIDLETNTRVTKVFHAQHNRGGKNAKTLTDSRDIYEAVANQGARRLRACILAVVPGDVVDYAVELCEETQRKNLGDIREQVTKMKEAFLPYEITIDDITSEFGCSERGLTADHIIKLKRIFRSLKDGMGQPWDYFKSIPEPVKITKAEEAKEKIDNLLSKEKETEVVESKKSDKITPTENNETK